MSAAADVLPVATEPPKYFHALRAANATRLRTASSAVGHE
jgi:hypothetical protein